MGSCASLGSNYPKIPNDACGRWWCKLAEEKKFYIRKIFTLLDNDKRNVITMRQLYLFFGEKENFILNALVREVPCIHDPDELSCAQFMQLIVRFANLGGMDITWRTFVTIDRHQTGTVSAEDIIFFGHRFGVFSCQCSYVKAHDKIPCASVYLRRCAHASLQSWLDQNARMDFDEFCRWSDSAPEFYYSTFRLQWKVRQLLRRAVIIYNNRTNGHDSPVQDALHTPRRKLSIGSATKEDEEMNVDFGSELWEHSLTDRDLEAGLLSHRSHQPHEARTPRSRSVEDQEYQLCDGPSSPPATGRESDGKEDDQEHSPDDLLVSTPSPRRKSMSQPAYLPPGQELTVPPSSRSSRATTPLSNGGSHPVLTGTTPMSRHHRSLSNVSARAQSSQQTQQPPQLPLQTHPSARGQSGPVATMVTPTNSARCRRV